MNPYLLEDEETYEPPEDPDSGIISPRIPNLS